MKEELPNTLSAVEPKNQPKRPLVFDPALQQFPNAYRLGAPRDATSQERLENERSRAAVRNHLLRLIAASRWREHLVLRGSTLLHAWLPKEAREPGDLDWVFQPVEVALNDLLCDEFFAEVRTLVEAAPHAGEVEIVTEKIATDDIWTYVRAAGRRMVFPYAQNGSLVGEIQMDIVFQEPLPVAPIEVAVPVGQNETVNLWAATPELSLAWKLAWLMNDLNPMGKDLYDAVLLAEQCTIAFPLLCQVIKGSEEWLAERPITLSDFEGADWPNFQLEFPWIEGSEEDWNQRLIAAITPTFAEVDG